MSKRDHMPGPVDRRRADRMGASELAIVAMFSASLVVIGVAAGAAAPFAAGFVGLLGCLAAAEWLGRRDDRRDQALERGRHDDDWAWEKAA